MSTLSNFSVRGIASGSRPTADVLSDVQAAYDASEAGPEPIAAFLAFDPKAPQESKKGALAGVPVAVKDNIVTADFPTTCGSRILEGYVSPFEATAVRR